VVAILAIHEVVLLYAVGAGVAWASELEDLFDGIVGSSVVEVLMSGGR
jgi:hypothetical protein